MIEKALQASLLTYLSLFPSKVRVHRSNSGNFGEHHQYKIGKDGWPDITGMLAPSGRLLGIECKSKYERINKKGKVVKYKGKQLDTQKQVQADFEAMGALYILAYEFDDVVEELKEYLF